ncbi:MAG: histidine triad nucleotide-binding protein [Candidatus Nanopelagicales bacterium]
MSDCLFCSIVAGDIPADKVAETDEVLVFRDIDPKAPSHLLAIPKEHYVNVAELSEADADLAGRLLATLTSVSEISGNTEGYRVVFNTGQLGGQTVDHVHAHLLAGRQMTWPPG